MESDPCTICSASLASALVAAGKREVLGLLSAFEGSGFLTWFFLPVEVTGEDEEGLLDLEEVWELVGSCEEEHASFGFFERELESEDPFWDLDWVEDTLPLQDRDEVRLLELCFTPHSPYAGEEHLLGLRVLSSVSSHTSSTVTKSSMFIFKSSKR